MKYTFILIFCLFSIMSFAGRKDLDNKFNLFSKDSLGENKNLNKEPKKAKNELLENKENYPTLESVLNEKEKNPSSSHFEGNITFKNISCKTQWKKQGYRGVENDELNGKDQDSAGNS